MFEENRMARRLKPEDSICFAPTSSIYFSFTGKVFACCKNWSQIYGRYPEQTLEEIWSGLGRKRLKDVLSKSIFPTGCRDCAENLVAGNPGGMLASQFDELRAVASEKFPSCKRDLPLPISATFELGSVCNYECVMCSGGVSSAIRRNREKLPPIPSPYDDEFVRQLRPFIPNLHHVRFLGGEPFLNRVNFKVFDLLMELNQTAEVAITTNGSILNDRIKEMVKVLRPKIVISTESLEPERYEAIRVNGKFDNLIRNLDWFYAEGLLDSIAICPIRMNWQEIPEMVSYCNRRQLFVYFNTVVYPREHSLKYMSRAELSEIAVFLAHAKLDPVGPSRPGRYDVANNNRLMYEGLVNLVQMWRDEAVVQNQEVTAHQQHDFA